MKFIKGEVKDIDNVFTQHRPLLRNLMHQIGKLNETKYPFMSLTSKQQPKEVIIFIIGGITYEEALNVYQFNHDNKNPGIKVILGGNTIHNSKSFIEEIEKTLSFD